jgi:hypothetical protein
VAAIERAGGELDGCSDFWWIEARNLRAFADELRRASDPLLRASRRRADRYTSVSTTAHTPSKPTASAVTVRYARMGLQ